MRIFICFFFGLVLASCGTTFVDYDYDKSASFTTYTTYQYDFSEETGLSAFDEKRFIKYTDSLLQSRGLQRTDYNDIFIKIIASEFETTSRNTLGVGIGGGGGNGVIGVGGGIPIGGREMHQEIITTIYEAREGQKTLWEATSESDLKTKATPQKKQEHYKKLVTKIFSKYPPKS